MINWAEGVLRGRGKKDDIARFIMEELVGDYGTARCILNSNDAMIYRFDGREPHIIIKSLDRYYLKNLERNKIYVYMNAWKEFQFVVDYKCANGIEEKDILLLAAQYNIDIHINAYEKTMGIEQDLECNRKGEIVKLGLYQYEDWDWECAMPTLGG